MKRLTLDEIWRSKCAPLNKHLEHEEKARQNKYHNEKTFIDGFTFDSLKESKRYVALKTMQAYGKIKMLSVHVPFQLSVCKYICDFVYENEEGEVIVEDVKSKATKTAAYKLKKKLMLQELNILITEI